MDAIAGAAPGSLGQETLDGQEGFFVGEGLVPAGEEAASIGDHAGVVGVAQHPGQAAGAERAGGTARSRACGEPLFVQPITQLPDGIAAGGVRAESRPDQLGTLGVDVDGVDQPPLKTRTPPPDLLPCGRKLGSLETSS